MHLYIYIYIDLDLEDYIYLYVCRYFCRYIHRCIYLLYLYINIEACCYIDTNAYFYWDV